MNLYFQALVSLTFIFIIPASVNAQTLPTKTEIISKMRLVNDYWISQNTVPGNNQWARAVYFTGNLDFCKVYPKDSYRAYTNLWANNNGWALNGGSTTRNADNQTCGQAYIDLYNMDSIKQPTKISAIKTCVDNMVFNKASNDWTWIDALFMAMPVFARAGVLAKDTTYFSRMYDFYAYNKFTLSLYNATEGLWYRDASYKPPYATKNGQGCYWARGNGWVIGAHARILQLLPANDRHRAEYIQTFQAMAAALKDRQRTDGFWNSSLDDPNEYNGPETSGTAFFTYGIAWGINNHLLDSATYYPVVLKAWNGLVTTAVQSNGFLGYVQGVGAAPALATANSTQDFGVGGFLLAGTEVLKLASGTMPVPTNFGMNIVKATDKNHIVITYLKPLSYSTALNSQNYSLNNNISVISCTKGSNDSTVILAVSTMPPGSYKIQVTGVSSGNGEQIEAGESKSFAYSGIVAVTASDSEAGTSNTPDKTLDFDFSTRWSSSGIGQWILYDLGELKLVKSVDLAFYSGNVRRNFFVIQLSSDGITFTEVLTGTSSGSTTALENFDFADLKARYVKIIGNGNSQSLWNSITETRINWDNIASGMRALQTNSLILSPNPLIGDVLTLELENIASQSCKVQISDMTGKLLYTKSIQPTANKVLLKDIHLASGLYTLSVITANNIQLASKLLVQ